VRGARGRERGAGELEGVRELRDGGGCLEPLVEGDLLALKVDIFRPFDKARYLQEES
jgi:hypothetical protein